VTRSVGRFCKLCRYFVSDQPIRAIIAVEEDTFGSSLRILIGLFSATR
jgi:hypothetical protein